MKKVNCNLCGQDRTKFLFKKEGYNFVKCQNCGLIYVNPRDSAEEVRKRYQEPYFHIKDFQKKVPGIVGYFDYIQDRPIYEEYFEEKMKQIEKIHPKKGRILDIGCALGYFLNRAKAHGWETYGIEISNFAANHAKKFGHKVITGQLQINSFPKAYFDVITLFHTVEHLLDPLNELKKIHNFLTREGTVVITTPNVESFASKILGKKWYVYRPKEHFYNFSPNTLRKILEKAGFKKILIKKDNYVAYPLYRVLERITYNFRSKFISALVKFFGEFLKLLRLSKLKIRIPVGDIMVIGFK